MCKEGISAVRTEGIAAVYKEQVSAVYTELSSSVYTEEISSQIRYAPKHEMQNWIHTSLTSNWEYTKLGPDPRC